MFTSPFQSFPKRNGAPTSSQVMSDGEFESDWNSRLAAIPQYNTSSQSVQLAPSGDNYDASAASGYTDQIFDNIARQKLTDAGVSAENMTDDVVSGYKNSLGGANQFFSMNNYAYGNGFEGDGYNFAAPNSGASHTVMQETRTTNPEYARMQQLMQTEMQNRQENQTAQQQAYNSMSDQYQKNGMMGAGYTDPNFGSIDGLATTDEENPIWSEGLVDEGTQTGVYDPVASTEKSFWGL